MVFSKPIVWTSVYCGDQNASLWQVLSLHHEHRFLRNGESARSLFAPTDNSELREPDFHNPRVALRPVGGRRLCTAYPTIADMDLQSISVVLEFMRPAWPDRRSLSDDGTTRRYERRQEHCLADRVSYAQLKSGNGCSANAKRCSGRSPLTLDR